MFLKKFDKFKPLYKKILRLKENIQNKPLKKFLSFKKKKWKFFFKILVKNNYKKKKHKFDYFFTPRNSFYRLYDNSKLFLPSKGISIKKKFDYFLVIKQKFSLFYGVLSNNYIKKKLKHNKLTFIEKRLDILIYRFNLVSSIQQARFLIKKKFVFINNVLITSFSYLVKYGDLIQILPNKIITNNLKKLLFWPLPSRHFIINYRTLEIIFNHNFFNTNLSTLYPFWLNYNYLKNYYKC